jgi:hypothetical protein
VKSYIISWAQNATPVHEEFFGAMKVYSEVTGAEILIIPGRYKNPTSQWTKKQAEGEWWDREVEPYLLGKRVAVRDKEGKVLKTDKGATVYRMKPGVKRLCRNLTVHGDISVQPTATRPLSGFEVYTGEASAIFGHPKRALEVVPTGTRMPKVMWTTTACTEPNYTDSKSGKKGEAHHVLGALVVEVTDRGTFFARHVTWDRKSGSFTDLDTRYDWEGHQQAPRALSLTLGDWHSGRVEPGVLEATKRLFAMVRPLHVVMHDVLDFSARNHHDRKVRSIYSTRFESVEHEVKGAAEDLIAVSGWGEGDHETVVTRSNHDEHLERWLEEHSDREDPHNAPYFHFLWNRAFQHRKKHGHFPDLFALEARRFGARKRIRFLRRNESFRLAGVEHGFHGDKGNGGSRGNTRGYARMGTKVSKGHDHTPTIMDGVFSAGVTAGLDHGYNLLPSTWLNAHIVLQADGKRQLIIIIDDMFWGGDRGEV